LTAALLRAARKWLNSVTPQATIDSSMIDVQHDSPVPIHEQIISQILELVASGDLPAGTALADYRTFAQKLLTNPQVVERAYAELESEGVLRKQPGGGMAVVAGADVMCRGRIQNSARQQVRQAVRQGLASGLTEAEIRQSVDQALAAPPAAPLSGQELLTSFKKSPHASSHRHSQGIQDLSRQEGGRSP
jgi:GntR family transcriptional regulator